jgi:hypothetical protein
MEAQVEYAFRVLEVIADKHDKSDPRRVIVPATEDTKLFMAGYNFARTS